MLKRISLLVFLLMLLTLGVAHAAVVPPVEMRERNYGGSCAHASMATVLRMHKRPMGASWWVKRYRGGYTLQALHRAAERVGLPVVSTFSGDASFLEKHEGVVIDWGLGDDGHAVVFCGYRRGIAIISDPNEPSRLRCYRKEEFLAYWRRCGGRGVALLNNAMGDKR